MTFNVCCLFQPACLQCDEECLECDSNGPRCPSCRNIRQDGECVARCRPHYYLDTVNKQCLPCQEQCARCTGPTNLDCINCRYVKIYASDIRQDKPDNVSWSIERTEAKSGEEKETNSEIVTAVPDEQSMNKSDEYKAQVI